jgi:iron complex transport system permease protein
MKLTFHKKESEFDSKFEVTYRKTVAKRVTFIIICILACFFVAVYSATLGSYPISAGEVYDIIWHAITGQAQSDATAAHVVIDLRLPRILGAAVCGFGLAVCGTAMQSMMKNPLADPYTMGISSGAGFGAALAIILGFELVAGGGIVFNAFIFAVIPALVILFLSKFRKATPTMMILCGISLMYLFNAMTQLFMLIADPEDLSTVYTWMVGSLDGVEFSELGLILAITFFGSLYVQYMANQLNVMSIGDDSAKTLGVNVDKKRLIVLLVITLIAATIVSFTGIIGFVGLVAPHITRHIIEADNKYLIPASAVFGALLLLASDIVARVIAAPLMLPVGVITACIGGPLFMFLILRNNKEVWS